MSLIILTLVATCHSQWILSDDFLPRGTHYAAVGAYNGTISLLGGSGNMQQLIEYKIDSDVFVDRGQSVLSHSIWCYSQCSTQISHQLYIITYYSTQSISIYNMATKTLTPDWITSFPMEVNHHACITSSTQYLYVLGGYANLGASATDYHYLDTIQILQIATKQWLEGPEMLSLRGLFSCAFYQDNLYAIGGVSVHGTSAYLSSVEQIDLTLMSSKYIGDLDEPVELTRAVVYENAIWVMGGNGYYREDVETYYHDTVHIIDPNTSSVTLSQHWLLYPVSSVAAVTSNDAIYVFGGYDKQSLSTLMIYNTITIYITRDATETGGARLGVFACDGFTGHTLEHEELKINAGTYRAELYFSPKFQRTVIYLNDDDTQRTAIEIHAGNYVKDTEGCILVGKTRGKETNSENGAVWSSGITLDTLIEMCEGKEITVEVRDTVEITTTDMVTTDVITTDMRSTYDSVTVGVSEYPTVINTKHMNGIPLRNNGCIWMMIGLWFIVIWII